MLTLLAVSITAAAAPPPDCNNNLLIDLITISLTKAELENAPAVVAIPKLFPLVEPNLISG